MCNLNTVPGVLDTDQKSIFKELDELIPNAYASCVVGKWHNSLPNAIDHPYAHGADDFMGVIGSGVEDYFNWTKVENHIRSTSTEYATSYFTDYAAQWINQQTKPWFFWLAQIAQPDALPSNKINDSYSFKQLLSRANGEKRKYNYMDLGANQTVPTDVCTIRNSKYKIIYDVDGNKEFFDLSLDPFEANNSIHARSTKVDTSQLSNGIYIISITDDIGQRHSVKMIIYNG